MTPPVQPGGVFFGSATPANPVGTATGAGENMVDTFDNDIAAQHCAKDRQFRRTEALTGGGRGADRTMVLDEQVAAASLCGDARHITLAASDGGEGRELSAQRPWCRDTLAIGDEARAFAMPNQ